MRFQYCEIPLRKTELCDRDSQVVVVLVEYNTLSKFGDKGEVAYWTEIGKGGCRFGFFSLERTSACFQLSGKHPDSSYRGRLIIFVNAGNRTPSHSMAI